jgi:serine/threonine protein kinase
MPTTWNSFPGDGRAAPGATIGGRYSLRTAIGTGGMGTVWRASDTLLRREVAVKEVVCPPGMVSSDREAMYERTMREARAAAALAHPSVVQVYDVVTEGGRPWIVMELLDARSLADMVIEGGPLAPRTVAKIGIALLGALEVAHAAGVLHRDVKPANVLICADGRCVLTDFGVARMPSDVQLTTPGMVLGSPHFISPERAMGHSFGPPSDMFSLGVTLFTAVEGRPPFDKGDPLATMHAVVEEPPAPFALAGPLAEVLAGLLVKDPAQRWDVPRARSALRELLAGTLAQNPGTPSHTDPWSVVPASQGQWTDPTTAAPSSPAPAAIKPIGGRALLPTGAMPQLPTGAMPQTPTGAMPMVDKKPAGLLATLRALPRNVRIGLVAGVAVLLLAGTVAAAGSLFGGSDTPDTATVTSASPTGAPSPVDHAYQGKGYTVVLPKGWKVGVHDKYIEVSDPQVDGRWIRLIVTSGDDAAKLLTSGGNGLKKGSSCSDGYQKLGLTDVTVAGRPGSALEYQCTPRDKNPRHGMWYAAASNGKVYQIYLSTVETDYSTAKPIFDAAAATFTITA